MDAAEIEGTLRKIKNGIRITKVVATRSVKGSRGDSFAGFSAAWDTLQEDGGHGLVHVGEEADAASQGMSLKEARIAHYMVAMQADIGAYEAAMAGGNLPIRTCQDAIKAVKANYSKLIQRALGQDDNG